MLVERTLLCCWFATAAPVVLFWQPCILHVMRTADAGCVLWNLLLTLPLRAFVLLGSRWLTVGVCV